MSMILDEQKPDSPYVYMKWHAQADDDGVHLGVAMEYWTFFFRQEAGEMEVVIGAPHNRMLSLPYKARGTYWGVLLKAHLFLPLLSKRDISAAGFKVPIVKDMIQLGGQAFPLPSYEHVEVFIESLVNHGVIVAHPVVKKALEGSPSLSERTIQRHVLQIAGLTRRDLLRIRRARQAYALLQAGKSISEVVVEAGYTDQAHLTKSLKLLAGQTPGQILAALKD